MTTSQHKELQLRVLEDKFAKTPAIIEGKHNKNYYSLKGKITNLKAEIFKIKKLEWLAK